jgi:hypothetical protein
MANVIVPQILYSELDHNGYLCTYELYGPVCNFFDACRSIMRAVGRGLGRGPCNRDFFGPCEMELSHWASAICGPLGSYAVRKLTALLPSPPPATPTPIKGSKLSSQNLLEINRKL